MALVNLKRTKADKKARESTLKASYPDGEDYPYGLTLRLDADSLKKLGITTLPATGTKMYIEATASVTSTSDNQREGRHDRSIELQIQEMELETADEEDAEEEPDEVETNRGMRSALDEALAEKKKKR